MSGFENSAKDHAISIMECSKNQFSACNLLWDYSSCPMVPHFQVRTGRPAARQVAELR